MCRYAHFSYKAHFACFPCRKSFKRRLKRDVDPHGPDVPARCPQCGGLLAELGLDFKPPPQRAKKRWDLVAQLWTIGVTFHSCGCQGPGYRPRAASAWRAYRAGLVVEYRAQLAWWQTLTPSTAEEVSQRASALAHWRGRVKALEAAR